VRARPIIVADVTFEEAAEVILAEHDHVVQTCPANRLDRPFQPRVTSAEPLVLNQVQFSW
jgi:hypothetical protein